MTHFHRILHRLVSLGLSALLLMVCSCESCGDRPNTAKKKKQKKVRRVEYRRSVTSDSDTLLTDTVDTVAIDSLLTDSVETEAEDSVEPIDSAMSAKLAEMEFAVKHFVEVKKLIPDLIEEIRYNSDHNFVGRRIAGYEESVALLTKECAEALKKVADELREEGYRLKIYDAYRPDDAVQDFRKWVGNMKDQKMKDEFYPDIEKSELFKAGYISSRSKHRHGSTVDMTLCDQKGNELDMGGHFDFFSETSHSDHTESLTEEQQENRKLLREAMERNGFKIANTEWWHFSLIEEPYPKENFNFPVKSLSNMLPKPEEKQSSKSSGKDKKSSKEKKDKKKGKTEKEKKKKKK